MEMMTFFLENTGTSRDSIWICTSIWNFTAYEIFKIYQSSQGVLLFAK